MDPLTKSALPLLKQLRKEPPEESSYSIVCPRCGELTSKLVRPQEDLFTFACSRNNESCYSEWLKKEKQFQELDFNVPEALDWKKSRLKKNSGRTRHYQFTLQSMTLLDRKRNILGYTKATELFLRKKLSIPTPKEVKDTTFVNIVVVFPIPHFYNSIECFGTWK